MDGAKLRAWWWRRQGLDGSLQGKSPAAILERSGWARSVGGAGPYFTLFSRGGVSREAADAAAAKQEIHELPSARGCTYVLPASDFALGLMVGQGGDPEMRTAMKLGVTEKEIDALCSAVVKALAKEPLEPDQIREATGKASRSLGEEGKKKGLTTTLPIALGRLQSQGSIRRISTNGRFDQQRYRYAAWSPSPLQKSRLSREEAMVELARRYFRWIGPATAKEFQWFSGLGVKESKQALEPLGLVPLEKDSDRLMTREDRDAFDDFRPPREPQVALVGSIDAIVLHRRDVVGLLDPRDMDREVLGDKGMTSVARITDLPSHAILDRGRLVGLWEYDVEAGAIAWTAWIKGPELKAAVTRMESFVRDQLGDARSFSLDSPKSRKPRLEALRAG
jgi:hypothetical protein